MTTRQPRSPALAVMLIVVAAAAFIFVAYHRNSLQRQAAPEVERRAQVAQQVQQGNESPASWDQRSKVPVGLERPVALAWTPQTVYVAGDKVVRCLRQGQSLERDLALPEEPTALAATKDRLIVGFRDHITAYTPQGLAWSQQNRTFGPRAYVTSVAVVGSEVWVADSGNRVIHRCRDDASVIADLGRPDAATGYPGLMTPSPHLDLAVLPSGNVAINNPGQQRVEVWSPQGKLLSHFGKSSMEAAGFAGCCNPIAVAALPDGRIVTAEKGLVRVKAYRADGTLESVVATPPALARGVTGLDLATTANGEVLVLDPRARAILTFSERAQPAAPKASQ